MQASSGDTASTVAQYNPTAATQIPLSDEPAVTSAVQPSKKFSRAVVTTGADISAVSAFLAALQSTSRASMMLVIALAVLLVCYISMRIVDALQSVINDSAQAAAWLVAYRLVVIAAEAAYGVCAVRYARMAVVSASAQPCSSGRSQKRKRRAHDCPDFAVVLLHAAGDQAASIAAAAQQHVAAASTAGLPAHVAVLCTAADAQGGAIQTALSVLPVQSSVHTYVAPAAASAGKSSRAGCHLAALLDCVQRLTSRRGSRRALICVAAACAAVSAEQYKHAMRRARHSPMLVRMCKHGEGDGGRIQALDALDAQSLQLLLVRSFGLMCQHLDAVGTSASVLFCSLGDGCHRTVVQHGCQCLPRVQQLVCLMQQLVMCECAG